MTVAMAPAVVPGVRETVSLRPFFDRWLDRRGSTAGGVGTTDSAGCVPNGRISKGGLKGGHLPPSSLSLLHLFLLSLLHCCYLKSLPFLLIPPMFLAYS